MMRISNIQKGKKEGEECVGEEPQLFAEKFKN
jgi:hypothetical protein